MKALKYVFLLLLIAIIGIGIYVAVQPNSYKFNRSHTIKAPVTAVFNKVNDYKNWPQFSPWLEQEPNATLTYENKTSGIGAGYAWNGKIVGEGTMKTTALETNTSITQHLQFISPFESEATVTWNFENTPQGTKVTWGMNGENNFMAKLFTTFMGSTEDMVGPDYERGLAKLDSVVVAELPKHNITINGIAEHPGGNYIYTKIKCEIPEYDTKMKDAFPLVENYIKTHKIEMNGTPFIYFHKWNLETNAVTFSCCFPVKTPIKSKNKQILNGKLKPFKALKTTLKGDYKYLKNTWETALKHIETDKNITLIEKGPMLETYITNPLNTPNPDNWVTELFIAVK